MITTYNLTSITGAGSRALKALSVADLNEGDRALVVVGGIKYYFVYSEGTTAENTTTHPYIVRPTDYLTKGIWTEQAGWNDADTVAHIASTANPHAVTKTQVSLGNVDDVQQMPLSYLDTTTTLGTSDIKVPSQNATKTYVDTAISAIPDPLVPKDNIDLPADFPTLALVQVGWTYWITTNVTDDDATKTNTGLSFLAGDEIFWDGSTWINIGSTALWKRTGTALTPITSGDDIGATGDRISKGWFTDLQVTNTITGSITTAPTTAALISQATPQTIGDTTNRLLKLWATDVTVTNAIAGSVTGNAGTVTNATLTTALAVNTGTVELKGDVLNNSSLTIGAGAVTVSGTNTGDQSLAHLVPYTGATGAVDLGTHGLTTTGTLTSGAQTVKGTVEVYSNSDDALCKDVDFKKSRGTFATPTIVTTGDKLGCISFLGHDGAQYLDMAGIECETIGTIGLNRVPTRINFYTSTDASPSVKTLRGNINQAGVFTWNSSILLPVAEYIGRRSGIALTSTDAVRLENLTAATLAVPVQMSPRLRLRSTAWETTGGTSQTVDCTQELLPISGATASGSYRIGFSIAGGSYTYPIEFTSGGRVISTDVYTLTLAQKNNPAFGTIALTNLVLTRNVADAIAASTINNLNAGSTGNIADFQWQSINRATISKEGFITSYKPYIDKAATGNATATAILVTDVYHPLYHGFTVSLSQGFTNVAGSSDDITAFADAGGGEVTVTSAGHALTAGDIITIRGTTNYEGHFVVRSAATNTFTITATWVADDGTGTWMRGDQIVSSDTWGILRTSWSLSGSVAANAKDIEYRFIIYKKATDTIIECTKCLQEVRTQLATELHSCSSSILIDWAIDDRIIMAVKNKTDDTNVTIKNCDICVGG